MKVLVCGGRKFNDEALVNRVLGNIHSTENITLLIHGRATGADQLAGKWAKRNGVEVEEHAAKWSDLSHPDAVIRTRKDGTQYDALAGLRRNSAMLERCPKLVVAFPGGSGTADMVHKARLEFITVIEVK
jgi:hypothetical protein